MILIKDLGKNKIESCFYFSQIFTYKCIYVYIKRAQRLSPARQGVISTIVEHIVLMLN